MAFTQVTVTQDYTLADGTEPIGTVTFAPTGAMLNNDLEVPAAPVVARLDSAGSIAPLLYANTDPGTSPGGTTYLVTEDIGTAVTRARRSYYVAIPHDQGGSIVLSSLAPLTQAPVLNAGHLTRAVADSLYRSGAGVANVKAFGALGNGSADDSAAFTAALTAASAGNLDVVVPSGTYRLNSGLTWDCAAGSFEADGYVALDFSGMGSGYALTVRGVDGRDSVFNNRSSTHRLAGFQITGPDTDATTVDFLLAVDGGNLSQVNVSDLYVYGFRDQFYFGNNTWCWRFQNCTLGHAHRRVVSMFSGTNAGENYSFYGCTFFSSTNAASTATAVYGDVAGNSDAYFFGCSFDYNDVELDWNSGVANLVGCHVEDHANNSNPMVKLTYTGGNAHTTFTMTGGSVSPTESTPGRDHLIETTGDNVSVSFTGVKVGCYGMGTDLVKVISGSPAYSWQGGDLDTNTGTVLATPGSLGNVLRNGDFELGALTGWSNGGTIAYTAQTGTVASGTYALKMAGTGVVATSYIRQIYSCPPSVDIHAYADLAADTVTGGSVAFQVQFKDQALNTISTSTVTTISANQSMTRAGTKVRSPRGTAYVYILFAPTNLNGNVYADNCYAAVMAPSSGSALLTFGTSSNTITEGSDTRVTGAAQKASNLSDLASAATARTNLGLVLPPPFKTGSYYVIGGEAGPSTSNALGVATFRAAPVRLFYSTTLVRLGVDVTVIGDSGCHFRLGIYADDGGGLPGALVIDAGQVAADSVAQPEATISTTLAAGLYWFGGAVQDVTTTQPTLRTIGSGWQPPIPLRLSTGSAPSSVSALCFSMSSVTGALPGTFTVASATSPMARISYKTT